MAVGPPPPPPTQRLPVRRDRAYYAALGEEQLKIAKRLIEIAGELQNAGSIIGDYDDNAV